MCRSIKRLRVGSTSAPAEEIDEAALQFVRKISGYRVPSAANRLVFDRAVDEVASAANRLLEGLTVGGRGAAPAAG